MIVETEIDAVEVKLMLEGIRLRYGYDFNDYAEASIRRRILGLMRNFHIRRPMELLDRLIHDSQAFEKALPLLTVGTSEMFRDPPFFRELREKICPILQTYPTLNIWCAGCSTGEEIYSLAITLSETGLLDRSVIYATDINPDALRSARDGIFRIGDMQRNIRNYQESGGSESFSRYYTADYGLAKMNSELIKNTVFSEHNLAMDSVFAECHLILCRNVMIYFNKHLQERVFSLFEGSLRYGGYLALGSKESLRFSRYSQSFESVSDKWKIYRKAVNARSQSTSRSALHEL